MNEIFQTLREEEATLNLPIKTCMDGINEAFYSKDCYYRNKNSPSTTQRNNSSRNGHVFTASHREEKLCDNIWILDSGASCHMAKQSVWFKNISPEVMDIYLADKNSKIMSQGTGNVSAKTVSTKNCNSINLTITDVSYCPQLRCEIENETWDIDSFFDVSPERNEINQNTENGVLYNFDINNEPGAIENDNSIPLQTTSSPRTGRIQIPVLEVNDVQNQIPVRCLERLKSKLMSVHLVNNVPNSYFEAENSANWKNWKLAMENELHSLDKHKAWEIVQKPAKSKLIKTKWVYSLKQDDAGKNIKYKARLVAAGFNQIKNIDYSESYSPVVNIESFRLLVALAAKLKLNVNFFDVKTAYLYGDLEETVYVLPSPGYEKLIGDDKVGKLKRVFMIADEQALQFAAEDNAKVLWDKIRATYISEGEDRKIDAGNELKNISMKNGETVADYIGRARGISTKCHSLGLDVSPRELVYHTVRAVFLKVKSNHLAKDCYYRNKNSPSTSQRNNSSRNEHVFTASHREEKLCDNIWILDSGASCHMAKQSVWFKNISPEVMDIYLADKNSKIMSQGTGNVSAKTVSTKHCNSINLTITDVSYVPQLRCNLMSVTCLMDKGSKYENLTDKRIKKIRTDNGLEFVNEQLDTYLANSGIFHVKTIPYNSESNGNAEKANRVLLERARSLLYESEIENETWDIDSFFEVSPERNEINQNTENGVLYNFDINNGPGAILRMIPQFPFRPRHHLGQAESKFRYLK
ncbi:retrovirus-related Pol polyprotein from transposon TNT 1-94 [Trichonephila clavipes]|nr:retrovirus-related Pol polyprotein from transposon TNT 1-94 [Trichonephila clavipes]